MPFSAQITVPTSTANQASVSLGSVMPSGDRTLPFNQRAMVATETVVWMLYKQGASPAPNVSEVLAKGAPITPTKDIPIIGSDLDTSRPNGDDYFFAVDPNGSEGDVRIIG